MWYINIGVTLYLLVKYLSIDDHNNTHGNY